MYGIIQVLAAYVNLKMELYSCTRQLNIQLVQVPILIRSNAHDSVPKDRRMLPIPYLNPLTNPLIHPG